MSFSSIFPWSVWDCPWLAPAALCLDLLFGDPALPWRHPVCAQGRLLDCLEKFWRNRIGGENEQARRRARFAGFLSLMTVCLATAIPVRCLVSIPCAGWLFALYFAWAGLAMGCLLRLGKKVLSLVENGSAEEGRAAVSWLVSRETQKMDRQTLRKTLADTISENYTDAFLAPFFWLLLTGPVGLWIYKAVSTMDSQWGYKTPDWIDLGKAGARADDILAFIPARISPCAFFLANLLRMFSMRRFIWRGRWPGYSVIAAQAAGMPSPNSGWPMAACAWLCGCRMAGPSVYFGVRVPKPRLGPPLSSASFWNESALLALCQLSYYASLAGGSGLWLAALAARRLFSF